MGRRGQKDGGVWGIVEKGDAELGFARRLSKVGRLSVF